MIIWIIGMSAAGKTVISEELYKLIKKEYKNTVLLDVDIFRGLHNNDLDYTTEGRRKNGERIHRMCLFLDQQNINVVCASIASFSEIRQWNRDKFSNYFEVFLDVPLEILVKRDPKRLYKKVLSGEIKNVIGIDIPYVPPKNSDLTIENNGEEEPAVIAQRIFNQIKLKLWEEHCS